MKKIFLPFLFCLIVFTSCNKTLAVPHNEELAQVLAGTWELSQLSTAEYHPDESNPDIILGILTFESITRQKFLPQQVFETTLQTNFVSFDFAIKDSSITEEDLRNAVNQEVIIYGKYFVNNSTITIANEYVSVDGGEKILYKDFLMENPMMGSPVQTMTWKISGNMLSYFITVDGQDLEVTYKKSN